MVEMPKQPLPATAATTTPLQFVFALLLFCVSSVCMLFGNKMVVGYLPLPCTLVIIQAAATLVLLLPFWSSIRFKWSVAVEWIPIAALFALMLFSSLKSFVYAGVSTVLIFRNIGAIFTTFVEYFVRNTPLSFTVICSEIMIVVGAVVYGWSTANFSWLGLFWILVNVGGQVAYGVTVKYKMDRYAHFKEMSKYTMSFYNNLLGIPLVAVVLFAQQEHLVVAQKLQDVTEWGWVVVALTCFFGFLISTSGFGLQKLVSATTFLVINNLTKFLNILLGMVFLSDKLVGILDTSGCCIALLSGFWYSYEQMKLNEKPRK